jgi:hypothetical protein
LPVTVFQKGFLCISQASVIMSKFGRIEHYYQAQAATWHPVHEVGALQLTPKNCTFLLYFNSHCDLQSCFSMASNNEEVTGPSAQSAGPSVPLDQKMYSSYSFHDNVISWFSMCFPGLKTQFQKRWKASSRLYQRRKVTLEQHFSNCTKRSLKNSTKTLSRNMMKMQTQRW